MDAGSTHAGSTHAHRGRWGVELALVAALSLGQSAIYAIVNLVEISTRGPIVQAQARLNTSESARPVFDLVYQLLGIGFTLVPVALALWFMTRERDINPHSTPVPRRLGLGGSRAALVGDLGTGALLFAVIGVGTLGVFFAGRALGITADIQTNNLGAYWWTAPVLLLHAVKNGVLEEVLLLGFGADRLTKLRVGPWATIAALAVFRGTYHLYQGWGPFIGNIAMGLLFGYLYMFGLGTPRGQRTLAHLTRGRVAPFVVAHVIIDAVGFLAPGILAAVDPR